MTDHLPDAPVSTDKHPVTEQSYDAAIPACCSIKGVQAHKDELMLCWSLVAAIEDGTPMDCGGCPLRLPSSSPDAPVSAEPKGERP